VKEKDAFLVSMNRFLDFLQDQKHVSPETLRAYRNENNRESIDGLPGLRRVL